MMKATFLVHLTSLLATAAALVSPFARTTDKLGRFHSRSSNLPRSSRLFNAATTDTFEPVFDFADESNDSIASFERIDDAVMGGISTSTLKKLKGEPFARWTGVCRLDGG